MSDALPRCPLMVLSAFSLNERQCARWAGHTDGCMPYMVVIAGMAHVIRWYYDLDEDDAALEEFVDDAKKAWARRVTDE